MPPKQNIQQHVDETHTNTISQEEIKPHAKDVHSEGSGRFEYQDGSVYQGQWKLIGTTKAKHGNGTVVIASTLSHEYGQKEEYEGQWVEDKMDGQGTYKYKSGAQYIGSWKSNMHHGQGKYIFADVSKGCSYLGEWFEHKMHGEGVFTDQEGNKWSGEFVQGIFQSKMQKQLKMEKMIKKKQDEITQNSIQFFIKFQEAFTKSDKKTFKENLLPFFATSEEIKLYVKDPYPKYEDRVPEKWNDQIKLLQDFTMINVLRNNSQAKIIETSSILAQQFSGIGQVVEFQKDIDARIIKIGICNVSEGQWSIIFYHDNQDTEHQAKKK